MAEQAENEPSMEEILSSIRRIINEDDDDAPAEAEAAPEPVADEPNSQDDVDAMFDEAGDTGDVLELTDKVDEPEGGTDPLSMDDDLMIVDREEEDEPEAFAEPEPEPEPEPVYMPTTASQVNLLALLGGLLILMGGMVGVVRTRL